MREITKNNLDQNSTQVAIIEEGEVIISITPPSIWAFKNNTINELNDQLKKLNKSELTVEELSLLQGWMDEA